MRQFCKIDFGNFTFLEFNERIATHNVTVSTSESSPIRTLTQSATFDINDDLCHGMSSRYLERKPRCELIFYICKFTITISAVCSIFGESTDDKVF